MTGVAARRSGAAAPEADGPAPAIPPGPGPSARPWIRAVLRNDVGTSIELLDNGAVFAIRHGPILVNQVLGSPVTGSMGNLYLRRLTRGGAAFAPLLGPAAPGTFHADAGIARWTGSIDDLDYRCSLRLAPGAATWAWTLEVANRGRRGCVVDAVLAADLGLGLEAFVRSSEAYASQYIDHAVLRDPDLGVVLCSRQNLPQDGAAPWIMHGCLDGAVGFATDALQVHGVGSRATGIPEALAHRRLPGRVLQYEVALPTLASRPQRLAPGATTTITFFAAFEADHQAPSGPDDLRAARRAHGVIAAPAPDGLAADPRPAAGPGPGPDAQRPAPRPSANVFDAPRFFASRDPDETSLERWFPRPWRHVERSGSQMQSFFRREGGHVVLRAKELASERPTGLLLRSGRDLLPVDDILSVTAWMDGAFASQLAVGNTSFNRLLGVARDPLNVGRASGLRVFVGSRGGWEQLGVPSAMEMSPGGARWVYDDADRTIVVTADAMLDGPAFRLAIDVRRGEPVELLVTHEIVLGEHEHDQEPPGMVDLDPGAGTAILRPGPSSPMAARYPDAAFLIAAADPGDLAAMGGDELLNDDGASRGCSFLVMRTRPVSAYREVLAGSLSGEPAARSAVALAREAWPAAAEAGGEASAPFWSDVAAGAALAGGTGRCAEQVTRLDDLLRWYVHDALIHVSAPHGLEQSSGAAWGVRDVCQGPAELFLATRNTAALRELVLRVYARQRRRAGDWPQWFMTDRYHEVQAPDSHGDIIHWPIKLLCDYMEATGDLSILAERVPWTDDASLAVSGEPSTILAHTEAQLAVIEREVIPGTRLPVFGGGDWEDTLQPVDPEAARHMVSAWTTALAFQTIGRYRDACARAGQQWLAARLEQHQAGLRDDFNRHLVPDGIVTGLAHMRPDGVEYLLHPRDDRTGVSYRLIPMTRSIIGGLFTPEQAVRHADLVEQHLLFPDGVRLQDRPMRYRGGTSAIFRRAESAASFGREVGLQYVHAHIRYVEAMAVLGRADAAFRGLLAVCPILLASEVLSALPRQANAYFSSSDGAFGDRYEASRRFERLRDGRVGVKGGWRVYSSGPGIYLRQLVANILGLRDHYDDVVFDPVLPAEADGLTFDQRRGERRVRYRYALSGSGRPATEVRVNGRVITSGGRAPNPYRTGGLVVSRAAFESALGLPENTVDIVA